MEMASVPVMTAEPTANARSIRNSVSGSVAGGISGGGGTKNCPVKYRYRPMPIMLYIAARNT